MRPHHRTTIGTGARLSVQVPRRRRRCPAVGAGARLSVRGAVWHPGAVTRRSALGEALHRAPGALRRIVPRALRDDLRRRVGPFAPWEAGFPRRAPAPGPGEVTGPPDFVGIGVQKAGTTWWYGLIAAHPGVHHPAALHKERHYFAPFATRAFGPAECRAYGDWFPRPPGSLTGEWTPDYLYQRWVPPLLERAAPEARLLVVVRDPVARLVSGLAHSDVRPGSHLGTVSAEAVQRGFYAEALAPWAPALAARRLLVLQYERCVADPAAELARTYRFLGLDDAFVPPGLLEAASPTRLEKVALDADARDRLVELYRPDVERLVALVPDLDLALWPGFGPGSGPG